MLTFYYHPLSINSRRVWITLLEKNLAFNGVILSLTGDQFKENFTQINPFQKVPVLIDQDLRLMESLAILDYLEMRYPLPRLLPENMQDCAQVKMVEMLAINELQMSSFPLIKQKMKLEIDENQLAISHQKIHRVLAFFESLIKGEQFFFQFGFSRADITAGTIVGMLPFLNFSLEGYPQIKNWLTVLNKRETWQKTTLTNPDAYQSLMQVQNFVRS